jgi:hypothetical protein
VWDELSIAPKDISKLMKGELTVEDYAKKYNMKIEHVENFKKLYLMLEKTKKNVIG